MIESSKPVVKQLSPMNPKTPAVPGTDGTRDAAKPSISSDSGGGFARSLCSDFSVFEIRKILERFIELGEGDSPVFVEIDDLEVPLRSVSLRGWGGKKVKFCGDTPFRSARRQMSSNEDHPCSSVPPPEQTDTSAPKKDE